jgi:acyl carrier protein
MTAVSDRVAAIAAYAMALGRGRRGPRVLTAATHLFDDLRCDEFDLYDIVVTIEDAFDIELHERDIDRLATLGDIAELVERTLSSGAVLPPAATPVTAGGAAPSRPNRAPPAVKLPGEHP